MGVCASILESKDSDLLTCGIEHHVDDYLETNQYIKALSLCHKAIDYYSKSEGPFCAKNAELNLKIVRIYERQLMTRESLLYYERAFTIFSTLYGIRSPKAIEICTILAKRYQLNHDYEKSAQFYKILLDNAENSGGTTCTEAGDYHDKLGEIYRDTKNYRESALHYGAALECLKKSRKGDPEKLAIEYSRLGSLFLDYLSQYAAAIECFENTVDLIRSCQGEIHQDLSLAHLSLGIARTKVRHFDKAVISLKQCISIGIQCEWTQDTSRFETLSEAFIYLCAIYEAQGKLKESLECEKGWCKLNIKAVEVSEYYKAYFTRLLGDVCFELKEFEEAAKTYFEALELFQNIPDSTEDLSRTLLRLGRAYFEIEDDRADACLKEALICQLKLGNEANDTILQIKKHQALSLSATGHHEEAVKELNVVLQAYEVMYKPTGRPHVKIVDVNYWLGKVYRRAKRLELAYDSLSRALEERTSSNVEYLLKDVKKFEAYGVIFQLPDLELRKDTRARVFKIESKRLSTKAEVVGYWRVEPSLDVIRDELEDIG